MEDERKGDITSSNSNSSGGGGGGASATDSIAVADAAAAAAAPAPVAVVVPRLKKVRKRAALKSSTTALDDDADDIAAAAAAAAAAEDGADSTAAVADLQTIKLMQKLRSKSSAALVLGEGALHLPEVASHSASASSASAASAVTPAAPGKEFGAEGRDAQAVLIETQMEKYIAEAMAANRAARMPQQAQAAKAAAAAAASASSAPAVNLSEDQLFVTPAHLRIAPTQLELPEEESGERWLTGIAECSVSIRDKMRNIEQTERAKAKLLAEASARRDPSMVLPANYNSNFRLHKKSWDTARREEFRAFDDATNRAQALAAGLPAPPPTRPWAQDMPLAATDARALPGFLAGPGDDTSGPRRDVRAMVAGDKERAPGQRGSAVPNASDDRAVDRFIKRFKYK